MILLSDYPNPLDPTGVKFSQAVALPERFVVENLSRRIVITYRVWASLEALLAGAPYVNEKVIEFRGDKYFDLIEGNSEEFLTIAELIDLVALDLNAFDNATQGPVSLPIRPEPEEEDNGE